MCICAAHGYQEWCIFELNHYQRNHTAATHYGARLPRATPQPNASVARIADYIFDTFLFCAWARRDERDTSKTLFSNCFLRPETCKKKVYKHECCALINDCNSRASYLTVPSAMCKYCHHKPKSSAENLKKTSDRTCEEPLPLNFLAMFTQPHTHSHTHTHTHTYMHKHILHAQVQQPYA
jgi:hypothetical protein